VIALMRLLHRIAWRERESENAEAETENHFSCNRSSIA